MDWPHGPLHRIAARGIYFITAGTYLKQHYYRSSDALDQRQKLLFAAAEAHRIRFHSWSLLSNHYHLIVEAQQDLTAFIRRFHSVAAIERNRQDATAGRRAWYQRRTSMVFGKLVRGVCGSRIRSHSADD